MSIRHVLRPLESPHPFLIEEPCLRRNDQRDAGLHSPNNMWLPTRLFLKLFARFDVRGLENLPENGPLIFAANHASEFDAVLLPAALPCFSSLAPIFYVAKEREFYGRNGFQALFYGGAFFKLWGAYPVREGLKNYKLALSIHTQVLSEGKCVLIFPEGNITPDGTLQPAHGGVAYLAWEAKAPVIPVAIQGTFGLTPRDVFSGRRQITVSFGMSLDANCLFGQDQTKEPNVSTFKTAAESILECNRSLHGAKE